MADSAFQIQYRQEFIAGFEQGMSMLRAACTTEAVIKGNQAVFLVADSGGAAAVTRGLNGRIPPRTDNLTQNTATLVEWHDKPQRTEFNIFASQGDGRRILQMSTVKVMNRQIDQDIFSSLTGATANTGAYVPASLSLVIKAKVHLGLQDVDTTEEDNMFFVISPSFEGYLLQIEEFASSLFVEAKPLVGPAKKYRRWAGFNWIVHPHVPGVGTSTEKCYAFHRAALGHAVNTGEMDVRANYNEEEGYYWARSSIFMGSVLMQQKGVMEVRHDGSAYT